MDARKFLIANWKMNPQTYEEAELLVSRTVDAIGGGAQRVVLCAPFPWLTDFSHIIKTVAWGAQDVFWKAAGAFTGEVSPAMLKNSGVSYVILGHSERRKNVNETDEMVNKKIQASLEAGLTPILCVGEWTRTTLDDAKRFVEDQLTKDLENISGVERVIVTYEPVWAISTNKGAVADTPENAHEMIMYIKGLLDTKFRTKNCKVIYGGSVNSKNIAGFLKYDEIEGFLIGGASLIPEEMGKMYVMSTTK